MNRLPGLLGLDKKESNVVQVFLDGEIIYEYIDNALGKKLLGAL